VPERRISETPNTEKSIEKRSKKKDVCARRGPDPPTLEGGGDGRVLSWLPPSQKRGIACVARKHEKKGKKQIPGKRTILRA